MTRNIWVISDTHFGHANILSYSDRPFSNVTEMDEYMVTAWNETVKDGDIVYHLGDVYFSSVGAQNLPKLKGRKRLVLGNHDDAIVVDTNQNVGIGTTAPNYKLNIIGSFSVFSQAPWLDGGSSAFVNENGFIDLFCSSTGITNSTLLHLDSTGFISLNCDNELTLQASGGNVGIGESYPTAKLHVVGKFRLVDGTQASGNVLTSDTNGNTSWQHPDSILPYRKYVALLSQSDTSAPIATILENTLGEVPTWEYISTGNYILNSSAVFTLNKTVAFIGNSSYNFTAEDNVNLFYICEDPSMFEIQTSNGSVFSDDILKKTPIEIRVYK